MTVNDAFVHELLRAANEVPKLLMDERSRLLDRSAAVIRDLRQQIAISGAPANDQPGDIASDLAGMARTPAAFAGKEISAALLHTVEVIRTLEQMLDVKREVVDEASETEGSA